MNAWSHNGFVNTCKKESFNMKRSYDELLFAQNFFERFLSELLVKIIFLWNSDYFEMKILND
jgi:hypothetical protein